MDTGLPAPSIPSETNTTSTAPIILRLSIQRFRGIATMVWYPAPGLNILLGGGDVGKSTILDAIALLLSPTNTAVISDADYWCRKVDDGFCIEAVMSLPDTSGINEQTKQAWPWEWNGTEPILPSIDADPEAKPVSGPVYRLRVQGTSEFDVVFEVLQPDETAVHLPVAVRRSIGLVRLGGDDRNDRDLRLVQGSALERLLSDRTLRARLGQNLADVDIEGQLKADAKQNLATLDGEFQKRSLPTGLSLGMTGGQGLSLNALLGLTAHKNEVQLPLASWGAGTRRLAALEIAAAHQAGRPITLVDEVERGLEPYRQRLLMSRLQATGSQVFITTHSAPALAAATSAALWYLDHRGVIGQLKEGVRPLRTRDPEVFFARLAIVAEGKTECGFVQYLLELALGTDLLDHGIRIADADGNSNVVSILEALTDSGLTFAGFADDEGNNPTRWDGIKDKLGRLLFRWQNGCIEQNVIALVPEARLQEFIADLDGDSGERLRTLAERLGIEDKTFSVIQQTTASGPRSLKQLIIEAATGTIPEDKTDATDSQKKALKRHGQRWFKSIEGGRELARKVFTFNLWPDLKDKLLPFVNGIRVAVGLPELPDILS